MPDSEWRCFHCGDVFTDEEQARLHFGSYEANTPACRVNAQELRTMEQELCGYRNEDTELHREIGRLTAEIEIQKRQAEEAGYARGLLGGVLRLYPRGCGRRPHDDPSAAGDRCGWIAAANGAADRGRDGGRAATVEAAEAKMSYTPAQKIELIRRELRSGSITGRGPVESLREIARIVAVELPVLTADVDDVGFGYLTIHGLQSFSAAEHAKLQGGSDAGVH